MTDPTAAAAVDEPPRPAAAPAASLAFDRLGAGEPLVLLHGLGGERHVWEPVLATLAEQRELIVVDLPGFGASPELPEGVTPTPAALAVALARLLDELALERVHVAGNSLGGWVALELALLGRARSVTALCSAGFWSRPLAPKRPLARMLARALKPALPLLVRSRRGRRLTLGGNVAHPERVPQHAALRLLRSYATAPAFTATNAAMRAARFEAIERVPAPVTLAWAEHDRLVAPPRAPLPDGIATVALPDCGHLPMWDDPALVAAVLLQGSARRSDT